jgi:hypothetical protein
MKLKFFAAVTLLCVYVPAVSGQVITGSRSAGMGGAVSAYRDDVSFLFENPASIAGLQYGELGLLGGRFMENSSVGTDLGAVRAFKLPMLGRLWPAAGHIVNSGIAGSNYVQAGLTLASEDLFLGQQLRWGTSLKYATDSLAGFSSIAVDVGVQSDYEPYRMSFGFAAKNFFSSSSQLTPAEPALGAVWHSKYGRFSGEFSWLNSALYCSQGYEADLYEGLLVGRVGLLNGPKPYATLGFGAYLWPFAADAAFGLPTGTDNTAGYFQVTLRYRFDGADFSSIFLNNAIEKAMSIEGKSRMKNPGFVGGVATLEPPDLARETVERPVQKVIYVTPKQERAVSWPQYNKVQAGQTLRSLAQKFYGDPNKWQLIFNANPGKIERGQPRIGEELLIPQPR